MGKFKRALVFLLIMALAFPAIVSAGAKSANIFRVEIPVSGGGESKRVVMDGSSQTVDIYGTILKGGVPTAGFSAGCAVTLMRSPDGEKDIEVAEASLVGVTVEITDVDLRVCQCEWWFEVVSCVGPADITVSFSRIEK